MSGHFGASTGSATGFNSVPRSLSLPKGACRREQRHKFLAKHILEHYIIFMRTSAFTSICCRGVLHTPSSTSNRRGEPPCSPKRRAGTETCPYIAVLVIVVLLIIIMGVCNTPLHASSLILDNTNSGQRRDGSMLWDIRFAIEGIADNDSLQIFITPFTQSGETLDCYSLTGDYPYAIGSGSFHIIWDIGADVPNREFYSDSIVIKLAAARAGVVPGRCAPHIYIADYLNARIVRIYDMNSAGWIDYGSLGSGDSEFNRPFDIAVAPDGRIYIADWDNHRIVRIDDMFGAGWTEYGSYGTGDGEFNNPAGIAVGLDGRIYIADTYNNRIVRIDDMSGTGWTEYGSEGYSVGEFYYPHDIAISPDGRIYIADTYNYRIVRINDMDGDGWITYGILGDSVGEFYALRGIAVGLDGRIYIADGNNHRIVRIDDMSGTGWIDYGIEGSSDGEFYYPRSIAIGPDGRIYITDRYNYRIVRIDDMFGTNWTEYGTEGSGIGEFNGPWGIFVAP